MNIKRFDEVSDSVGEFINKEFSEYGTQNEVALNYDEFCFVAEDEDGSILGVITGRTTYNEVHVVDLIVRHECRKGGIGSRLVSAVENAYKGKGFDKITLTTYGFQAPDFYKKQGFELEFVREDKDHKLSKYFFSKKL